MPAAGVKKKRKKSKDSSAMTANIITFKTGVLSFFIKDPDSFWNNNTKKPHKQPDGWPEKRAVSHGASPPGRENISIRSWNKGFLNQAIFAIISSQ
jgi:hypothetical protein